MAVGILGGVFDPPHLGHVALARAAVAQLGLDELLVLVVADPGHKAATTSAETRLELARLAFADVPGAIVELDRHARTVDFLEERQAGGRSLHTRSRRARILRELEVSRARPRARSACRRHASGRCARRRVGRPRAASRRRPVVEFEMEPVAISSSEIRARHCTRRTRRRRASAARVRCDLAPGSLYDARVDCQWTSTRTRERPT